MRRRWKSASSDSSSDWSRSPRTGCSCPDRSPRAATIECDSFLNEIMSRQDRSHVTDGPVSLSVIIPAFNEERRLPATLERLITFLEPSGWDWEIRVVDDGSTDGTAQVAEHHNRVQPRIVLQQEPHRGKGGAVRAGMLRAIARYRFLCDADLSMPAKELPRFFPPLAQGADIAIGSREGAEARRVGEPWRRHITGRAFNWA